MYNIADNTKQSNTTLPMNSERSVHDTEVVEMMEAEESHDGRKAKSPSFCSHWVIISCKSVEIQSLSS